MREKFAICTYWTGVHSREAQVLPKLEGEAGEIHLSAQINQ